MNENSGTVKLAENKHDSNSVCKCVHTVANILQIPSLNADLHHFAAQTVASNTLTLISIKIMEDTAKVTVNCEKMVVGSMLFKDLKSILAKD